MIMDAHNHIGKRKGPVFEVEELLEAMDGAGVDMCVVFSFPEAIDNDYVARSVEAHPDRLSAFATINPWAEAAEEDLRVCIETRGFRGLWLHPVRHGYMLDDHSLLDPLLEICSDRHVPVFAYGAAHVASIPNHFEELALAFPEVAFIIAHMGYMYETSSAISIAAANENVYLETSSVGVRRVQKALLKAGAEKLVLGTNTPHEDFQFSIQKIRSATSDLDERGLILGRNILRILGMS